MIVWKRMEAHNSVRGGLMVLHRGGIFVESLVTVAKVGGS